MIKRLCSFYLAMIAGIVSLFAQAPSGNVTPRAAQNHRPASPEATAFQRYGEVPVSYQSGVADISIPLGSINLKGFEWPISLSYHSGGNKVGDVAGSAGLGWTLNAAGMISNVVIGKNTHLAHSGRWLQLTNYTEGTFTLGYPVIGYDNEMDIFRADEVTNNGAVDYLADITYYNTPLFNFKGINMSTFPATDYKISSGDGDTIIVDGQPYTYAIKIKDLNGNTYLFKDMGSYNMQTSTSCAEDAAPGFNRNLNLTKIITYSGEILSFSYTMVTLTYNVQPSETKTVAAANQCQRCVVETPTETKTCTQVYTATEAMLNKIESSQGHQVRFFYSNRSDLSGGVKVDSVLFDRIINGTSEPLKKYELVHDYFGTGTVAEDLRLKLTELKLYDSKAIFVNKHLFEYNAINLPNRVQSKAIDWFGYYNGAASNATLLPDVADRTARDDYSKASILEKITYPTGGYTTFGYERNPFGGLRVKEIRNYAMTGILANERSFDYHVSPGDGSSHASLEFEDNFSTFFYATNEVTGGFREEDQDITFLLECITRRLTSSPITRTSDQFLNLQGNNFYQYVTEYYGANKEFGKTDYYYSPVERLYMPSYNVLTAKKVYKKQGNDYILVSETADTYTPTAVGTGGEYSNSTDPLEKRVWIKDVKKVHDEMVFAYVNNNGVGYKHWGKKFFQNDIGIASVPVRLTQKIEKFYDDQSEILNQTFNYYYDDSLNLSPTRIETTNSKGDATSTHFLYPTSIIPSVINLTTQETAALANLAASNVIASPFYTEKKENTNSNYKLLQTYATIDGTSRAVLKNEKIFPKGQADFSEKKMLQYDTRGNLLEYEDETGLKYALTYNEFNQVQAHTTGAGYGLISYSSFESGATGNWDYTTGGVTADVSAVTGSKTYNLSVANIQRTGLNSSTSYVLTYWLKNGSGSVSAGGAVLTNKNGWSLYRQELTGVTSVTLSGTGVIDELRLYPKESQMATYAYDPHIGVISQCDINNKVVYYEYDKFQRLMLVRDHDKNIIKQFCYQYAGTSPVPCAESYTLPNWQNAGSATCETGSGSYRTGYQLQLQRDENPNSISYNQTRTINTGINAVACPVVADWSPTSGVRCITGTGGYKTGGQEREEKDLNPYSGSYNQLRWVSNGTNATVCPLTADWLATSALRCVTGTSGYKTGEQEHEEKDNNPYSATYNQLRWISDGSNTTACPLTADWSATSNLRCVTGTSGYKTGQQEREERDLNPYSLTYNQLRWVSNGTNTDACPLTADWSATSALRCVTGTNGYKTGQQEREEKDLNPYSSSYNQLRWVSNGTNTTACPLTADWLATSALRCVTGTSGYKTGEQEHEEKDNNPYSVTYNQLRWISNGTNTTACPLTADWSATGNLRCVTGTSGYKTGAQEREERDNNPYSVTYSQLRWISNGTNTTACPLTADWSATSNLRCVTGTNGYKTGQQEREERDLNPYSATYNQLRWVSNGANTTACPLTADWSATSNLRCVTGTGGYRTGAQEREERDLNPYSVTYNQLRWVSNGTNTTACPLTPDWSNTGNKRCVTSSGYNTGIQEAEQRDNNPYTAYSNRWVNNGTNTTACPVVEDWVNTGNTNCVRGAGGYYSGVQEAEQHDNNPVTGAGYRWVDAGYNLTACPVTPDWTNTSNYRCVTNGGYNTGQQERQQYDNNPYSGNGYRWVSVGSNTTACPVIPDWTNTGNTRCESDGVHSTGYQEAEQRDQNPNTNYGYRWIVSGYNPGACPLTPDWVSVGNYRCIVSGAYNTGGQEVQQYDVNPYTNYGYRWVYNGYNGSACPVVADWSQTGNYRCVKNGGYNTGVQEREEVDNNPYSGQGYRWVNIGNNTSSCPVTPDWVATGNTRCVTANGYNTGYQEIEQHDNNPNTNSGYRWVSGGANSDACPLPSVYVQLTYENTYISFDGYTYADVVIRTYSDYACTQPVSMPGLDISCTNANSCNGSTSYYPVNGIMAGSVKYAVTSAQLEYANPWCSNPEEECVYPPCTNSYYLEAGPGYQVR